MCGCPSRKMGGIARRAKFIQRFVELKEQVIQVDSGDSFFAYHPPNVQPSEEEKQKAIVIAKGSAKLNVDAINVGLFDLSAGLDFLNELKAQAREYGELNLISSNLVNTNTNKPVFPTEKIVERSGVKIGIFGLCRESPDLGPNLIALPPKNMAEIMVKRLKKTQKVDLIIGLFNLGLAESKSIAMDVPGIDIIVVSGYPQTLSAPELVNQTIIFQAGAGGKLLGQIEIDYYRGKKPEYMDKELSRVGKELERVNNLMKELEPKLQTDASSKNRYEQLKVEKEIYERKLKELKTLPFNYKYALVPLDQNLPLDPQIDNWVRQAMKNN